MRVIVAFFLSISLIFSPNSFCKSNEQEIVEELAKAYAKGYVESATHNYVKNWTEDQLKEIFPDIPLEELNVAMTFINMFNGLNDMNNIDDDDQKNLAGANVIADAIMLANPALGGIVKGVLFVVGMLLYAIDHSHMRKMLEYQVRIMKANNEEVAEVQKLILLEIETMTQVLSRASFSSLEAMKDKNFYNSNCRVLKSYEGAELIHKCTLAAKSYVYNLQMFLLEISALLEMQVDYVSLEAVMKALDQDLQKVKMEIVDQTRNLEDAREKIDSQLVELQEAYLERKWGELQVRASLSRVDTTINYCYRLLSDINMSILKSPKLSLQEYSVGSNSIQSPYPSTRLASCVRANQTFDSPILNKQIDLYLSLNPAARGSLL
ncbi:MAG: hypothetical protein VX642_12220 [Bdellovibrionota bacterium]|nr:hypothetical protein [Bdellovibrionota bacterium]